MSRAVPDRAKLVRAASPECAGRRALLLRAGRQAVRAVALAFTLPGFALAPSASDAAPAVFQGDPVDAATAQPYVILPGVPLVLPGLDDKWGTADDVIDPGIVGDVDIVVRTGGTYTPGSGVIPPPATSVAAAPEVVAGGLQLGAALGAGTEVPYQLVLSDGAASPAAGHPLAASDVDGRGTLALAYADLDGDGFVGPSAADGSADDALEVQEAVMLAGRRLALLHDGVASGSLAVALGLPASTGGLGVVVAGGAITGATPPLYKDGPWIATLLPCMWPLDPDRIIGGENAGPPDAIGLVDIEVEMEWLFCPAPGHPVLGTPYAIPLDGSSVTTDLARAVSGQAATVTFAQTLDAATFVADQLRRVLPAIGADGARKVVEPVTALSLPDDGPGNGRTVVVFPADLLGNDADPPAGGLEIVLEASPGLRIASPDSDADPSRETLLFTTPRYVAVVVDDAGQAGDSDARGQLLAAIDGIPATALRVTVGSGDGGTPSPITAGKTVLRWANLPGRDHLRIEAGFDANAATLGLASRDLTIALRDQNGLFYTRTLPAGSLKPNAAGTAFRYHDPAGPRPGKIVRLVVRQSATDPLRHTLKLRLTSLNLSTVDPGIASLVERLTVGTASFEATLGCVEKSTTSSTTCTP